MGKLSYYLKIYRKLIAGYLKGLMSYKADFIVGMIGVLFMNMLGVLTIYVIFRTIPSLAGWSYYELIFMYGFFLAAYIPFGVIFENLWHLGESLWMGDFVLYYFKPVNIFFSFISESINAKSFSHVFLSIVLLIYSGIKLQLDWGILKILFSAIFFLGSSAVLLGMNLAASATAFWTGQNHSIMDFIMKLNEFSRYPFTIFTKPVKFILTYIIPFVFIAYYPVNILLHEASFGISWFYTPAAGIGIMLLGCLIWSAGVRRYCGTGS